MNIERERKKIMRPIDADAVFERAGCKPGEADIIALGREFCNAPILDVAPIIHAHWIDLGTECFNRFECSNCISCNHDARRYCPNCGAKMDGEKG